jgi:anti-sigma B factor antagonist
MKKGKAIITVERHGDTLLLSPHTNLREGLFGEMEHEARAILNDLQDPTIKNVILDFSGTDFIGSSALGHLVRLRSVVESRNGRMALCNLSEHQREILQITKLDKLWPVCSNRDEALRTVRRDRDEPPETKELPAV